MGELVGGIMTVCFASRQLQPEKGKNTGTNTDKPSKKSLESNHDSVPQTNS